MIVIIYEDIKIYRSNTKPLLFSESCVPHPLRISLGNKQPIASIFFCRTITHWYTDFRCYLDFHKMRDVQGFCLACHIFANLLSGKYKWKGMKCGKCFYLEMFLGGEFCNLCIKMYWTKIPCTCVQYIVQ